MSQRTAKFEVYFSYIFLIAFDLGCLLPSKYLLSVSHIEGNSASCGNLAACVQFEPFSRCRFGSLRLSRVLLNQSFIRSAIISMGSYPLRQEVSFASIAMRCAKLLNNVAQCTNALHRWCIPLCLVAWEEEHFFMIINFIPVFPINPL